MRAVFCALQLGRMLLGRQHGAVCLKRFTSQALVLKQRKHRSIYHGTCDAHFHSSCGVVVEWQMYVSHCTCGAQSSALMVRCTPDARDNTGDRDIPGGLCWSGKCMYRIAHVVRRALHLWCAARSTCPNHCTLCVRPLLISARRGRARDRNRDPGHGRGL